MNAAEFANTLNPLEFSKMGQNEFAEAYHKAKVNSITDKEILKMIDINDYHSYKRRRAYISGFTNLKNKLLNQ